MNWEQAIDRQRSALLEIVGTLFAMLGLEQGQAIARLSLPVYRAALRILYPAESAVRRLIMAVARGLAVTLPARKPPPANLRGLTRKHPDKLSFQLCDAKRFLGAEQQRSQPKFAPRIHAFSNGQLVTILGRSPFEPLPQNDNTRDATRLCRRLAAIKSALENLPHQARRLARWRARVAVKPPEKIRRPLRLGPPPGHRDRSEFDVDEILKDCHWLAREAAKLDTS